MTSSHLPEPRAEITLTDLFEVEELQKLQDAFAQATKVASIITTPDGTPVTQPSNFCRLCNEVIRQTEKGRANCFCSDSVIGRHNPVGPIVQICLSGGLWDAGASITVNGQHIGNWLVGQVRNESTDTDKAMRYAKEIGADEQIFREALEQVQVMSTQQLENVARLVFMMANELSLQAYQNLQLSAHLIQRKQAEIALRESGERLQLLLDVNNAIVSKLELGELLDLISKRVRSALQCDAVYLAMPDPESPMLVVNGLDFPRPRGFLRNGMRIDRNDSGPGIAFTTGKPHHYGTLPEWINPELRKTSAGEGFQSECCIPVIATEKPIAVLTMSDHRESFFPERDIDFLLQVASQVAIALGNALQFQSLVLSRERLAEQNSYLSSEIEDYKRVEPMIGNSREMRRILEILDTVAKTDLTVLIQGETGTGKELIARAIHNRSSRRDKMFVKFSCAAIPSGLLESELFGHEKGSYTGAIERKIGRFELANGGTLFLDEVGDIPLELQPKLLRVLQEQEFERLGSNRSIKIDVRLVSATNRSLESMVSENQFRPDLFYRLNVFPIQLPPLRERTEDIPHLVRYYVLKYSQNLNRKIDEVPAKVMEALIRYDWPGNVRELQNLIQRAVLLSPGNVLSSPFPEMNSTKLIAFKAREKSSPETLLELERKHIQNVLKETSWVLGGDEGAASRLGIPRTTLLYRMKRLGIARHQS